MARGRYFTEYEKEIIRIGVAYDVPATLVAAYLGRTDRGVRAQIQRMRDADMLGGVPFELIAKPVAEAMRKVER